MKFTGGSTLLRHEKQQLINIQKINKALFQQNVFKRCEYGYFSLSFIAPYLKFSGQIVTAKNK